MEFRKLSTEEIEAIDNVLNFVGAECSGSSYEKISQKYYLGIDPSSQATPSIRKKFEGALGTTNLVINGQVKVDMV